MSKKTAGIAGEEAWSSPRSASLHTSQPRPAAAADQKYYGHALASGTHSVAKQITQQLLDHMISLSTSVSKGAIWQTELYVLQRNACKL